MINYTDEGDWETMSYDLGTVDEPIGDARADTVISIIKQRIKNRKYMLVLRGDCRSFDAKERFKVTQYNIYMQACSSPSYNSICMELGRNAFWSTLHKIIAESRTFEFNNGSRSIPRLRWHVSAFGWITVSCSVDWSDEEEEDA